MKKNTMMRLASALLVLVLLTTCAISGTFAKYVTDKTGTDSARVAKFGVEITANGSAFATEYATDDEDVVATIAKSVVTSTAQGADGKKLVAPGTEGSMVAMTLTGTPEVAVEVKYEATLTLAGWTVDNAYYCPIEITVGEDTFKGTTYSSADEFVAAVVAAINGYTAEYAPNQDLSVESTVATPDVSWAWAFEGNDDVKDTALGDAAAEGTAATIELVVKTTVTQID